MTVQEPRQIPTPYAAGYHAGLADLDDGTHFQARPTIDPDHEAWCRGYNDAGADRAAKQALVAGMES